MNKRPTSVTVIAWILIVQGGAALIASIVMTNDPMAHRLMARSPIPIPVQYAIAYCWTLVTVVSGAAMLKGCNWARLLYVVGDIAGCVFAFATSPIKASVILSIVGLSVIAFFLFRPKANQYFNRSEVHCATEGH